MVASLGWNPHFHNEKKTLEVHLLRKYTQDFYGSMLDVLILGYIRSMEAYDNLEDLRAAINSDITIAGRELTKVDTGAFVQQYFTWELEASVVVSRNQVHSPCYVAGWLPSFLDSPCSPAKFSCSEMYIIQWSVMDW